MADKDVMDIYHKDYEEHSQDDNDQIDIYDDVMDPTRTENSGNSTPHSEENTESFHYTTSYSGKKYQLYIGNLTWWTTDQDIADAVRSVGVQDFLEVKFFENRANGQSKGFCLISLGSEESSKICLKALPRKYIHGQNIVVTFPTKSALTKFENEAKMRSPAAGNKQGQQGQMPPRGQQPGVLTNALPPDQGSRQQHHQPPHYNQQWHHNGIRHPGPPRVSGPPHHMQQQGPPQPPPGMFPGPHRMPGPPMDQHGPPPPRPDWPRPPGMQGPGYGPMVGQGMQGKQQGMPMPGMHQPGPPPPRPAPPMQGMPPNQNPGGPYFQQAPPPRPPPPGPSMDFGPPPPQARPHHPPMQQYPMGGQQPPPQQQQLVSMDKQPQFSEIEFEEIMSRNRTVSSSAISRAISDAATGEFSSAIETLGTAISLIKQSKISNDDRCKILISSLQDTLHGVEAKRYASSRRERSRSRDRAPHRRSRRSRSRERSRDRYYGESGGSSSYGRERSRSRERDRERSRDDSSRYYEERYREREKERDRDRDREREREGRHSERERERESTRTSSRH
ncbi:cleavage and polyadenylation specificity factor subunit 6 isoform X1 [Halyomorpha halys]|uniref:cleavage and polyadenylation specificity factor subunit 6 isoform X1 n=2 Tax=Halyomorpha halys TaxID=286706 RepID=UPI0006D4F1DF|nr:cleavage and polyadenylation specificity factor subunit CG7185 isoform X1 [Halyomorpha halys]